MRERSLRLPVVVVSMLLFALAITVGVMLDRRITEEQVDEASDELFLLMTLRRGALESYFDTVRAELVFWSLSDDVRAHLRALRSAWAALPEPPRERLQRDYLDGNPYPPEQRRALERAAGGSAYDDAHAALHGLAREFVSERGYYDFFLIDPEGNVIYTVEKESDFAMPLRGEPLGDTGLAIVYRRALETEGGPQVVFSDFARYGPSYDEPALFGAIRVEDADGEAMGVLAIQVPTEQIQNIMQFTAGMGSTGETYLVGEDLLMRSDSRFSDASTTLETEVASETVELALSGESGVAFTDDYRGVRVLSAYGAFAHDGFDWAVMAEIDEAEVMQSISASRRAVPWLGAGLVALAVVSLWWVAGTGAGLSLESMESLDRVDLDGGGG